MNSENLDIALSYFIVPIMVISFHGAINLGWLGESNTAFSVLSFFTLLVISYEVGVKYYYMNGRKIYFYTLFLIPTILSTLSLLAWFLLGG